MPIALIGAVAGVAGAAISAGAAGHASDVASQTAAANNALQEKIYNQNAANEQPYIAAGNTANTALQGFLGLGGDPAKTQAAFDNYLNSTGYKFTRDQGIDAAETSASARGLLNSGAALKSLDQYGTGLAQQYGQTYADNLNTIANRGANSANALSSTGQAYANAVGSNNNNAAGASATAGNNTAAAINSAISGAYNAFAGNRGASSFGGGVTGTSASNAFGQPGYAPWTLGG